MTPKPAEINQDALRRLLTSAKMLQQNAEGCASEHYGHDFAACGMPGWLADTAKDIAAAEALLASLPQEGARACDQFAATVLHPTQTITDRCAATIRARTAGATSTPAPPVNSHEVLVALLEEVVSEFGCTIEQYNRIGPDYTFKDGTEVFEVSAVLDRSDLIERCRAALSQARA